MKVLVDTCGWIDWVVDGKHSNFFGRHLKHIEKLVVPTIVQYELYKWVCRERDETTALEMLGLCEQGTVAPLDTEIAIYAAEVSRQHKLAMADAIVYATSLHYEARLITDDKHFAGLANVEFPPRG